MSSRDRVGTPGAAAEALARELSELPQECLRNDRMSVLANEGVEIEEAMRQEFRIGLESLAHGAAAEGAARFARGAGRSGVAAAVAAARDDA